MNILDTFIVEIGLDPTKLDKGQKDAVDRFRRTVSEMGKSAKNMEAFNEGISNSFTKLGSQALTVFSLFAGGRGVKEFTSFVTQVDVAAGRMSQNLNIGVRELGAWYGMNERVGGSTQGVANSFANFNNQLQGLKATGEAGFIPYLRALEGATGDIINLNKPLAETFVDLATALHDLGQKDRAYAVYLGQQMGLDEVLVSLMIDKGAAIRGEAEAMGNLVGMTQQDIDASKKLNAAWKDTENTAIKLGRTILTALTPALSKILEGFRYMFGNAAAGQIPETSIVGKMMKHYGSKSFLGLNFKAGTGESISNDLFGGSGGATAQGAFKDSAAREAYIRAAAARYGVDPEWAVKVSKSEGFGKFVGDDNSSFGAFQLHYGGRSARYPSKGLGDAFTKKTGLDAANPANEPATIDFALQSAATSGRGWADWYGAAGIPGYSQFAGIPAGAGVAGNGGGNSHTVTVKIDNINIKTNATDAATIAQDIQPELKRATMAAQANYGQL